VGASVGYHQPVLPLTGCANRDLGTEGAEEADLALRKCIAQRIIPGPRYLCVTRAIGTTGSYGMVHSFTRLAEY